MRQEIVCPLLEGPIAVRKGDTIQLTVKIKSLAEDEIFVFDRVILPTIEDNPIIVDKDFKIIGV